MINELSTMNGENYRAQLLHSGTRHISEQWTWLTRQLDAVLLNELFFFFFSTFFSLTALPRLIIGSVWVRLSCADFDFSEYSTQKTPSIDNSPNHMIIALILALNNLNTLLLDYFIVLIRLVVAAGGVWFNYQPATKLCNHFQLLWLLLLFKFVTQLTLVARILSRS